MNYFIEKNNNAVSKMTVLIDPPDCIDSFFSKYMIECKTFKT